MAPFKKILHRAEARLRSADLPLSISPTKLIVISNGGIMNNIRRSELELFIASFGICPTNQLVQLILPKRKSYAFCHLNNLNQAETLVKSTQLKEHYIKGIFSIL